MCGSVDAAVDASHVSVSHLLSEEMLRSACMLDSGQTQYDTRSFVHRVWHSDAVLDGPQVPLSFPVSGWMWRSVA
jgi:hypothetical protein